MNKKIYISLLSLVFFLSTTSLPMTIHLCKMMNTTDTKACAMCTSAPVKKSCCETDVKGDVSIKRDNSSDCCSTQLIDATVKDNFLSSKTENQDLNPVKFAPVIILPVEFFTCSKLFSYIDIDTSPPNLQTNKLYLINSIFLI